MTPFSKIAGAVIRLSLFGRLGTGTDRLMLYVSARLNRALWRITQAFFSFIAKKPVSSGTTRRVRLRGDHFLGISLRLQKEWCVQ